MKKKTSIMIEEETWKDIQKTAIDLDKTTGEYITMLHQQRGQVQKCKCGHQPS